MRIGVDVLAIQSPHHGQRGIGRFSRSLLQALLDGEDGHSFFLYAQTDLPVDRLPQSPRATLRRLRVETERGESSVPHCMDRLARTNPDELDVLLILSPFEHWSCYSPPPRPIRGPKLAAIVYDLIPFLFPREHAADPIQLRNYRALAELRRYDVLLAISESTRQDCLRLLGLPPDRVVNISAATDSGFFGPSDKPNPDPSRSQLTRLGITKPFVLNVGGLDERKNTRALISAFALLPERLRTSHQLVLTFQADRWGCRQVDELVREAGLGAPFFVPGEQQTHAFARRPRTAPESASVVVTNEVSDETLRSLYQHCAVFVFPSLYEGFGLPLLEAMQCGAPVVAGNNSSQIEVVGDAGLIANVGDPADIAAKMSRVLDEPDLAASLKQRALLQSARFHWSMTAERTMAALTERSPNKSPRPRPQRNKHRPRIAFVSPLPPMKSGVSDYSARLLEELTEPYVVDLYHDSTYVPEPGLASDDLMCCDARLFPRQAAVRDYHAVVYQMGNSRYHTFLYELMLRLPGVVTLHDFCLAGFHLHYGERRGIEHEYIRNELLLWYPESQAEILQTLRTLPWDWDIIAQECARRGWYLNRRLLHASKRVVVHSGWCLEQVRASSPWFSDRIDVIPHGATPRELSEEQRTSIRDRFGIPPKALTIASFGFVHPDKLGPEALDAFRSVTSRNPSALFLFVGEESDGGATRRRAADLGLLDRVRFLGRQSAADFLDLVAVADIGINLRRPPTNGETSGALLHLLAAGVATIVTDVATFADYPESTVRKVPWGMKGPEVLRRTVLELSNDPSAREALGQSARSYVREHNDWPRVAQQYVETIERCHAGQSAAQAARWVGSAQAGAISKSARVRSHRLPA